MSQSESIEMNWRETEGPPVDAAVPDTGHPALLRELVKVDREIKEGNDAVDLLKKRRTELESLLVEWFALNGWTKVTCDGKTIYRRRELHVSVREACREQVIEWAKGAGFGEKVQEQIPPATLKAMVKEWVGDAVELDQIPEGLSPLLNVFEDVKLRVNAR